MGAGTPENGFWPGDATPDLRSQDESMNATNPDVKNVTDRSITDDRIHRALTENLEVAVVAPQQYAVFHDDRRYEVDVELATCGCGDAAHRDVVCKHMIAASAFHAYLSEPNTRLVARVVAALDDHGCAHDARGCAGPVALGDLATPCEGCMTVTPGYWTVWNRLVEFSVVAPDDLPTAEPALVVDLDGDEAAVATDGGQPDDDTDADADTDDATTITSNVCMDCGVAGFEDDCGCSKGVDKL